MPRMGGRNSIQEHAEISRREKWPLGSHQVPPPHGIHSQRIAEHYPDLHFDSIAGAIKVNPLLGDIILARKDIGTSYHIAVVVDDAYQQITDVTRGNDLIHATHVHRLLQQALDLPEPRYHHHQLIQDQNRNRLAKRNDS